MFSFPDILDPEFYSTVSEVSAVVIQSEILAFFVSLTAALMSYRNALKKKSRSLFWCGNFALCYALWNIFHLLSLRQNDFEIGHLHFTVEFARKAHLILSLLLPALAHQFFTVFFKQKKLMARLHLLTSIGVFALIFIPMGHYYKAIQFLAGIFVFGSFAFLTLKLWRLYRKTDDLKLKTRVFFVVVGMTACILFSVVGQIRAENFVTKIPLPFVGNILTAVLIYFVYQMAANPRLREIRELMLRGIRILLLTLILAAIFLILLAWVGENNIELFIFNTFIASFIILSILEPLRTQLDRFFLKQFIIDRYEFEEILKKLPRRLRHSRQLEDLSTQLLEGVRESGRVYQTALFLWDTTSGDYRIVPPSNLVFKTTLAADHPFIKYFKWSRFPLLLEQDQELDAELEESLKEMHSHLVLPLFKQDHLLGVWALRSSLKSTNPYTSFSNTEVELLEQISQEVVSLLDQLQHFESQERQERLAALGEMSAALAHEVRNPLGALQGAAQLLKTSPSISNSDDKECVNILSKEIDRMQKTVEQYLNFARKSEEPIEVDLNILLQKVFNDVKPKALKTGTQFHLEIDSALPKLKTDPLKLEQVLFNLVQNACEAFSKNIIVLAKLHQGLNPEFEILVKDDGPGIPAAIVANIFTPLFTTKKAGSGLGLPICKKIIESLGGELSVESKAGSGTTFKVLLPFSSDAKRPSATLEVAESKSLPPSES
ncbi:MAG: GAF domain-containing protein [Deltaproteobacteria bacterium]|nr:GAF domain-containing protein [Deltaproteobacteria bacterium]